jgi:hypothetical protein
MSLLQQQFLFDFFANDPRVRSSGIQLDNQSHLENSNISFNMVTACLPALLPNLFDLFSVFLGTRIYIDQLLLGCFGTNAGPCFWFYIARDY